MGYDPIRGAVVMFGGRTDEPLHVFNDTWQWDGQSWTEAHPAHSPGPADGEWQMAFDKAHSVLVLQQGNETWTWDGRDWRRAASDTPGISSGLAYDSDRQLVIALEADGTYSWDGTAWHAEPLTATGSLSRTQGPLAWDAKHHAIVMFGGGVGGYGVTLPYGDTWIMKSGIWSQAGPSASPPAVYMNQLVYDDRLGLVIEYGGTSMKGGAYNELWAWDGTDWNLLPASGRPPVRALVAAAYDSVRDELVIFGGAPANLIGTATSETWTWDGTTWTQRT